MLGGAYKIMQNETDYQMIALAITGRAAEEIELKSGIPSRTVDSFLLSKAFNHNPKIIIIDEAGMLGSEKFAALIHRAEKENASIVCIGDKNQLLPISAGKIHKDIQDIGIPVVLMDEVLRQETPEMEKLVSDIENYQNLKDLRGIQTAVSDLQQQGRFITIEDDNKRLCSIADMFIKHHDQDNTLILTGLNADRNIINDIIFKQMQDQGLVHKKTVRVQIKISVPVVGPKKYFSSSYEIGNFAYVENIGQLADLKLKAGQEVKIIGADHLANTITVQTKGKQYTIDCKKDINDIDLSVYKIEEREFAVGARVVMTKNDKKFKVKNGLRGQITNISARGMFEIASQDRVVEFHPDQYCWFDLGWAVTPYKAQGADANHVIHNANSKTSWLHTTEELYLAATRAKQSYTLVADSSDIAKSFKKPQLKESTIARPDNTKQFEKVRQARNVWLNMPLKEKQLYISQVQDFAKKEIAGYEIFLKEYMNKFEVQKVTPQIYQDIRR